MQDSTRLKQLKNVNESGPNAGRFGGGNGSETIGQYDLNPSGSKALKAASEHRAKIVTFYINGEPFKPGIRVSIVPGKDFHSLTSLYDYLNGKSQVTFGVRYIFTVNGKRVTSIDDLESGLSYVISDSTRFQVLPYGKQDKQGKGANNHNGIILNSEGVKSVSSTLPLSTLPSILDHSPRSQSLNSKEGKIVTIVNRKDPTLRTRVFLNLRSQRTFELVVKDLGQAVMVKDARRLYTSDGEEVS